MGVCDFYVRDKSNGYIHKVGEDRHDSIWVDSEGTLHYQNLQNGDGCSYKSAKDRLQGYEFVPSDCGELEVERYGSKDIIIQHNNTFNSDNGRNTNHYKT